MKKVVIFASGTGSNAENIIKYFKNLPFIKVICVFCNNSNAKVLDKAQLLNVDTFVFNKNQLLSDVVLTELLEIKPDLIVLAGFLLKFPEHIINCYPNKIINIHPALLPKYGGKGMYGNYIHNAILENKETETGITIHYVNKNYDEGNIIFQEKTNISNCISVNEIASKVHELEIRFFPIIINNLLS